jgi:hypothetical protein
LASNSGAMQVSISEAARDAQARKRSDVFGTNVFLALVSCFEQTVDNACFLLLLSAAILVIFSTGFTGDALLYIIEKTASSLDYVLRLPSRCHCVDRPW